MTKDLRTGFRGRVSAHEHVRNPQVKGITMLKKTFNFLQVYAMSGRTVKNVTSKLSGFPGSSSSQGKQSICFRTKWLLLVFPHGFLPKSQDLLRNRFLSGGAPGKGRGAGDHRHFEGRGACAWTVMLDGCNTFCWLVSGGGSGIG